MGDYKAKVRQEMDEIQHAASVDRLAVKKAAECRRTQNAVHREHEGDIICQVTLPHLVQELGALSNVRFP